jgi:hypothetical protein
MFFSLTSYQLIGGLSKKNEISQNRLLFLTKTCILYEFVVCLQAMTKSKISTKKTKVQSLKREYKISFTLNEKEYNMLRSYLTKHKINNQSAWTREQIMSYLWKKADLEYPTLFNESDILK